LKFGKKLSEVICIIISSHGIAGDKILCPRGSKVLPLLKTSYDVFEIELFVKSLSKNKTLIGRPKILIFDCCRGDEVNVGELKSFGKAFCNGVSGN
jgi:hypothetical protein